MKWKLWVICIIAVMAWPIHSQATSLNDDTVAQLAQHPQWQALLHINAGATLGGRGQSYIQDAQFFLAEDGAESAEAELRADIKAFKPKKSQARCDFPARYRFVAKHLGWEEAQPLAHCDEFLEWRERLASTRVSLVFPASYMNSPSSMFGHTFLRLDNGPDSTAWQSWAVNYAAVTSSDDNGFFYAFRGLTGGYPGYFSAVPYSDELQKYAHLENRDIWEYELDLSQSELDRLIDHLWELDRIPIDYYFMDQNCSFRLLELIQVARPNSDLLKHWRFAELPVDAVRALDKQDLITQRHYQPSQAQELERYAQQLSTAEKKWAKRLAKTPALMDGPQFLEFSPARQALIVQAAYRYLRFKNRYGKRSATAADHSLALLKRLNHLPKPAKGEPANKVAPEEGHGGHRLTLAGGEIDQQFFGEIGYRYTYHGLLDNHAGFLQGAQIEGLGATARVQRGQVKLEDLTVVSLRSFSPRDIFQKPISWMVEGGAERVWANGRRLAGYVQGGAGGAWRAGPFQPFALASARLETNGGFEPTLVAGGGARVGVLFYAYNWQGELSSAGHYFTNGEYRIRSKLAAQYALNRNNGIQAQAGYEHWRDNHVLTTKLQWHHYFD